MFGKTKLTGLALVAALAVPTAGCQNMTDGERKTWGTLLGVAGGAVAGRALAGKKHKTGGMILGALAGGAMGYLIADAFGESVPPAEKETPEYRTAKEHYDRGTQALADGDCATARSELDQSIASKPTAEAYNNRGTALLMEGDEAGAKKEFEAALQLDPNNAKARHNLDKLQGAG